MNDQYKTSDLYLASFLAMGGIQLIGFQRQNGKVYFSFKKDKMITKLETEFFARQGTVHPLDYADSIKNFKGLLYRAT